MGNEDPLFEIDSVPFLASSFDESEKLWKATRPLLAQRLDKQGVVLIYGSPWPPQGIYTKKPVARLADLEGTRFRAYSASTSRMAALMGAVPTTVQTPRSEEHTSELQSLMRISYAVFCLKKKTQ